MPARLLLTPDGLAPADDRRAWPAGPGLPDLFAAKAADDEDLDDEDGDEA